MPQVWGGTQSCRGAFRGSTWSTLGFHAAPLSWFKGHRRACGLVLSTACLALGKEQPRAGTLLAETFCGPSGLGREVSFSSPGVQGTRLLPRLPSASSWLLCGLRGAWDSSLPPPPPTGPTTPTSSRLLYTNYLYKIAVRKPAPHGRLGLTEGMWVCTPPSRPPAF